MDKKIKQIVGSVLCFLLSFGIAMLGSWALRKDGWWDCAVFMFTMIAAFVLLLLAVSFAVDASKKGSS